LSPYLFIIVMEFFSKVIMGVHICGQIRGIHVATGVLVLSHSMYADDLILFGAAKITKIKAFKKVLDEFGRVSDLEVNPMKSTIRFSHKCPKSYRKKILLAFETKGRGHM
jgi:Reverse transcriptase (RNA-dependent DNA polymerase)